MVQKILNGRKNCEKVDKVFQQKDQAAIYYLAGGPKRGCSWEDLMVIPPDTELQSQNRILVLKV